MALKSALAGNALATSLTGPVSAEPPAVLQEPNVQRLLELIAPAVQRAAACQWICELCRECTAPAESAPPPEGYLPEFDYRSPTLRTFTEEHQLKLRDLANEWAESLPSDSQ